MNIGKQFWEETARLMEEYRKEGNEQRVQGIVDCRILFNRLEEQSHKHGVMQAEASASAEGAAVGQRSLGTVTEGVEVTDIKTGQILNVEGYGFMFGRVNTGEIQCFNIGNVSKLPRGE